MSFFDGIVLGIIQGLTEFLPVSSSGHLVVAQAVLGYEEHQIFLDLMAHLGTLVSILIYYRKQVVRMISDVLNFAKNTQASGVNLFLAILIGSVPTAVIGLLFKDWFEVLFGNIQYVAYAFLVTSLVLLLTHYSKSDSSVDLHQNSEWPKIPLWKAFVVGCFQGLAITPGISRSGMTIGVGMLLGIPATMASLFSFGLSVPAILGASVLMLKDIEWHLGLVPIAGATFVVSFLVGFAALYTLVEVIKRGKLKYFSAYLICLALFIICYA
jgi:undecaprenyl-diphosphatase